MKVIKEVGAQLSLDEDTRVKLPSTRYWGSKRKIAPWIWEQIKDLEFTNFLDCMSGTAVLSYLAKCHGKRVFANDELKFNYQVALALVENNSTTLAESEFRMIVERHQAIDYPTFIEDTFPDIYYLPEENRWLDTIITNIGVFLTDPYKRSIALSALGQACLVKRPYNLFHRKNLYMRLQDVPRSFGNKATWDAPFVKHFRKFVSEYNSLVFDNRADNRVFNLGVFDLELAEPVDLVYIDPPYLPVHGDKPDYHYFYHFLEGIVQYNIWPGLICYENPIRPIMYQRSPWTDVHRIYAAFERLLAKFEGTRYIVVSYNSMGIPSETELAEMLGRYKPNVELRTRQYQYALSKERPRELLFIAY